METLNMLFLLVLSVAVLGSASKKTYRKKNCGSQGGHCVAPSDCSGSIEILDSSTCSPDQVCCITNYRQDPIPNTVRPFPPMMLAVYPYILHPLQDSVVCKNTIDCQNRNGQCTALCHIDYERIPGICGSDLCGCCIPICKNYTDCKEKGGRCDTECGENEDTITGICGSERCRCCVPKPPCENTTSDCKERGGHCAEVCCHEEETVHGICAGDDCVCCIPDLCDSSSCCDVAHGHCEPFCNASETDIPELCLGDKCTCCIPGNPCEPSYCCSALNGHCNTKCGSTERDIPALCPGENCTCCVPGHKCENSSKCAYIKGECTDQQCKLPFVSFPHLCPDPDCTCCSRKKPGTKDQCELMGGFCYPETEPEKCAVIDLSYGQCDSEGNLCCFPL